MPRGKGTLKNGTSHASPDQLVLTAAERIVNAELSRCGAIRTVALRVRLMPDLALLNLADKADVRVWGSDTWTTRDAEPAVAIWAETYRRAIAYVQGRR